MMGIITRTASVKRNEATGHMTTVGFSVLSWPPVASTLRRSSKEEGKLWSSLSRAFQGQKFHAQ